VPAADGGESADSGDSESPYAVTLIARIPEADRAAALAVGDPVEAVTTAVDG
jgi:hypothetical protein